MLRLFDFFLGFFHHFGFLLSLFPDLGLLFNLFHFGSVLFSYIDDFVISLSCVDGDPDYFVLTTLLFLLWLGLDLEVFENRHVERCGLGLLLSKRLLCLFRLTS